MRARLWSTPHQFGEGPRLSGGTFGALGACFGRLHAGRKREAIAFGLLQLAT
jgi:hypothetical protein